MTFILRDNLEEIRKQIEDAGISVCICCKFKDAIWLTYNTVVSNGVHGTGSYGGEMGTKTQLESIGLFILECNEPIFCNTTDEFIAKIKEFETKLKKKNG